MEKYDKLIRSERKTVGLEITRDGLFIIRAPKRMYMKIIEDFVIEKDRWIKEKKAEAEKRINECREWGFCSGNRLLYMGKEITLLLHNETESKRLRRVKLDGDILLAPHAPEDRVSYLVKCWYMAQAKSYLTARIREIASETGIPFSSVRLSGARRRWGSCSGKNNINLSWRLIMADPRAIDYVIIHELAHVRHKNHSSRFWAEVKSLMPLYPVYRRWLKDNSKILDLWPNK